MKHYIFIASLILSGCASKIGTTIPGETEHKAIGHGYSENEAVEMAVYTAKEYCAETGKRHAVDGYETRYKGIVSEKTRQAADTVSDVAAVAGVWLPGLGDDEDYQTVLTFHCL